MKVGIARRARGDLKEAATWWAEYRSSEQALRWYRKALHAIRSLAKHADRHPLADESPMFPFDVRQLTFGLGRKPPHRVVFTIRLDMVLVLRVRHLAQESLKPDEA